MGSSTWSDDAYVNLTRSKNYATKTASQIFNQSLSADMSPNGLGIREARDSDNHPESLAVMVYLDVTGSMGRIPEIIIKDKLGALMNTLIDNGIEHPQILFGAIGDHHTDTTPLQVGQFESGTEELDKWLSTIYPEGCGGGQGKESYLLAWLIGGRHTSIDCFEKRNEKGFLVTIGDEMSWDTLDVRVLKDLMGYENSECDLTDKQLLEEAQRLYNVYHIHINEGSYRNDDRVMDYWKDMLSERLIVLDDYNAISETIATLVAMQHGVDIADIVKGFDPITAGLVTTALATVVKGSIVSANDDGIIKL